MSFCDTTCTFTFFSVRHDQIKSVKEENEPLLTAVYIPAMRPVRTLVTFSLCCGKLHDFNESAYSLCLFDLVELLLARQFSSQLELRSLVRRFGLLFLFTKKMSRNPTNSFLSFLCRLWQLLFTDFNHVYLFQKLSAKIRSFLQIRADLCNFLFPHIDILLFLPQKSIVYVTKEYKVTHNLSFSNSDMSQFAQFLHSEHCSSKLRQTDSSPRITPSWDCELERNQ